LPGLVARLLPIGGRPVRAGRLPRGRYCAKVFSFADGEPLAEVWFEVSSSESTLGLSNEALDDSAFVRGFLQEARLLGEECFVKPGRWSVEELDEMARCAELSSIPVLHRELLLRVRRLRIADHDLVTPPMIEEDLENLSLQGDDTELFPWFSVEPYDAGCYICIDIDTGDLVRVSYREHERLDETPREYLRKLLQRAAVR
jgi:hypothetical protein